MAAASSSSASAEPPLYVLSKGHGHTQRDIDIAIEQTKWMRQFATHRTEIAVAWPRSVWKAAIQQAMHHALQQTINVHSWWNKRADYRIEFLSFLEQRLSMIHDITFLQQAGSFASTVQIGNEAPDSIILDELRLFKTWRPLTTEYLFSIVCELVPLAALEQCGRIIKDNDDDVVPLQPEFVRIIQDKYDERLSRGNYAQSGMAAHMEEKAGDDVNHLVGQFASASITNQRPVGPRYSQKQITLAIQQLQEGNTQGAKRTLERLKDDLEEHDAKKQRRHEKKDEN